MAFLGENPLIVEKKKRIATELQIMFGESGMRWFLCFGALLSVIRDKTFDVTEDIDIGVIGSIDHLYEQQRENGTIHNYIKSNHSGKILKFAYKHSSGVCIDIFRWVKFKGMYWHTYDYMMEFPKNGVPSKYVFKSMPKEIFDVDPREIAKKIDDVRFYTEGRPGITKHGTWVKQLPEAPNDGIDLQVPYMYGCFLDIAYPDWSTTRKQFGQSVGYTQEEFKSCKGLC